MERVTGIEPVTEAWEAFVIPFHHTRDAHRTKGGQQDSQCGLRGRSTKRARLRQATKKPPSWKAGRRFVRHAGGVSLLG